MSKYLAILILLFISSCCEPPSISHLNVCDQIVRDHSSLSDCDTSSPEKSKDISVSFAAYSFHDDNPIRFSLSDIEDSGKSLDEVTGEFSKFSERITNTERCYFIVNHVFKLAPSRVWPSNLLIEVTLTDDDDLLHELTLEFSPI